MLDINDIASQVKYNCNISDARYWGFYSPCGLLMRMRDLYRSENSLKPWDKIKKEDVSEWIGERERLWSRFEPLDLSNIKIMGKGYKPFDVKGINSRLLEEGYLYAAGYGSLLKPFFMLSEVNSVSRYGRYKVYITGRELARDLSTSPAMLQGDTIIARREAMGFFLWGKFEEVGQRGGDSILSHAFREFGLLRDEPSHDIEEGFERLIQDEIETYIHHELGEASQRMVLGRWWKELLMSLPYSRAELFIRAVKDILSDTCDKGMLKHIIKNKKRASLILYIALLSGYRRSIFPEIITAYNEFRQRDDWSIIEDARIKGYKKMRGYISIIREMANRGETSVRDIEGKLLFNR
ncbi:MAG: hypothetical protein Fur0020_14490 [Thermodesulfovibrionia bacterium]